MTETITTLSFPWIISVLSFLYWAVIPHVYWWKNKLMLCKERANLKSVLWVEYVSLSIFMTFLLFCLLSFKLRYKKLTACNVISRFVILKCIPYFSFEAHPSSEAKLFQLNHKYSPLHGSHQNQSHYHQVFLHQYLFLFNRDCSLLLW